MNAKMTLVKIQGAELNGEPVYDLVVEFPKEDAEFASELFNRARNSKPWRSVEEFISKNAKNVKINAIKIMLAGVIIASMPFISGALSVEAAMNDRFSMTYIYGGTVAQNIEYVRSTNNGLDVVSPSYFDIDSDGSLKVNAISTTLVNSMHDMGVKVVPFLSNHWDRTAGKLALANPEGLAAKIAGYIEQYNLDGVNVDIENVTNTERDAYTALVKALRAKIPAHKEVSVAVAANPGNWQTGWHGSYDYTQLGQNSDYLMIMAYDEHYEGGDAGPVASIGWVEKSIQYALQKTSKDNVVVGLPFFGRIWSADGSFKGSGVTLNMVDSLIKDYNATVTYDTASQSPKAVFTVKTGDKTSTVGGRTLKPGTYTVWYENEKSLAAKADLVKKYDLKGLGSWALGQAGDDLRQNIKSWVSDSQTAGTGTAAPGVVETTKTGYVTATSLNVRQSTSTSAAAVGSLVNGQSVTLVGNAVNGWYKVKLTNGTIGYVSSQYISLTKPSNTQTASTSNTTASKAAAVSTKTGYVTASSLNVRQSKSTSSKITGTLKKGQSVTLVGNAVSGWYQVKLSNGATGYVSTQYISLTKPSGTAAAATVNKAASATKTGYVTSGTLHVRQSKSTSSKVISTLKKGQSVTLAGNAANGWYQVKLSNGATGYVSSQNITTTAPKTTTKTGTIKAAKLNVRQSASTKSKVITTVKKGNKVTVLGKEGNGWYKVKLSNGKTGYVSTQYVSV